MIEDENYHLENESPTDPSPPARKQQPFKYTRSYKACLTCRKRKAKCDLGEHDNPPCMRCRRERRECIFEAERSWNKKRKSDADQSVTVYRPSVPEEKSSVFVPSTTSQTAEDVSPDATSYTTATSASSPPSKRVNHGSPGNLTQSLIKTVLASGTDALKLLSQAAMQHSVGNGNGVSPSKEDHMSPPEDVNGLRTRLAGLDSLPFPGSSADSAPLSPETYKLWRSCKFVKMGWLSAEEAVRYVDLFYEKMAPLSPTVTGFYADHANHRYLLQQEPLLCCAILFVSSRWHFLTGTGGSTRSYFAHDKLWKYFQHLLLRLVLGQEQEPVSKLRNLGSIEALLLATEWHARGLYFPPEVDGWDSDLISASPEGDDDSTRPHPEANQWLRIVQEAVKRSDRMSWMFTGVALSLAHELEIFSDDSVGDDGICNEIQYAGRKLRIRRILYLFANQLAARLGCTSVLPQNFDHKSCRLGGVGPSSNDSRQDTFLESWIELTKLLRSLTEIAFPSEAVTQQLVQSRRYASVVDHFASLLVQWRRQHLDHSRFHDALQTQLFIEYQYVRVLCNSIGMQAACERPTSTSSNAGNNNSALCDPDDRRYIEEVLVGSCDLLEKVYESFGVSETLAYAPVRVLLRVVSGSMFLMKALAIGARQSQVPYALEVLERTKHTLRSKQLADDMHLADRFAALLDMHIVQIRTSSSSHMKQGGANGTSGQATRQGSVDPGGATTTQPSVSNGIDGTFSNEDYADMADWVDFSLTDPVMDGWFSMPSNPTLSSLLYSGGMSQWTQS